MHTYITMYVIISSIIYIYSTGIWYIYIYNCNGIYQNFMYIYINTYTHSHAHTHIITSLSLSIYIHTHNSYTEYTLMHIHLTLSYWTFFQHQTTGSRVRKTSTSDLFLECLMPLSMFDSVWPNSISGAKFKPDMWRCVYHFSDTVSTPVRLFMSIFNQPGCPVVADLWQITKP